MGLACELSTRLQQPCTLSSQWWHQGGSHVALVWGWKATPLGLSLYLWGGLAFASHIF